jgi:predicted RNase H-like HicB family nuclease
MRGYVVVFEGDDDSGYSAYSPDLPGVVAAADTRQETEQLMLEATAEHLALLRELGQPVPEPADSASVTILDPAAAWPRPRPERPERPRPPVHRPVCVATVAQSVAAMDAAARARTTRAASGRPPCAAARSTSGGWRMAVHIPRQVLTARH